MKKFLVLSLSDVVFIMLINVKMPKIVGILTFMSRINFVLSRLNFVLSLVEHEKSCITSGPVVANSFPASGNFCCLLITFANSLDPDQDRQKSVLIKDPNRLTL